MKILKICFKTVWIAALFMLASCQPDEITETTGNLFLGDLMATGTDRVTGQTITMEVIDNQTKIPLDATFTITLTKPFDEESLLAATTFEQEGVAVPAVVSVEGTTVTIDPVSDMEFGKKYTITISNDVKATDGGIALKGLKRSFTTEILVKSVYDGTTFHMAFEGNYAESVSNTNATVIGAPGFTGAGIVGQAYAGATGSYLTFPTTDLTASEFSAVFWINVNAMPDRAGVLVIGPPDLVNPATPNNRTAGFRFFRENDGGKQKFKLNVGTGTADTWIEGTAASNVDPADGWKHFAITISPTKAAIYIDGLEIAQGALTTPISWEGCDILSIMSGEPRFTEWGHLSDESSMDELRFFNRELAPEDIQAIILKEKYTPQYPNEVFYMPFEGNFKELVSNTDATEVGTPTFAGESIVGSDAYAGATDSYLTFPTTGLQNSEFSASFWLKINAVPDRAGILVMGPPDMANPANPNNRTKGFRFFREDAAGKQRFKLNVGDGTADTWFDGGTAADVTPTNQWVHFAFTISPTECVVYINGSVVSQGTFTGVDWTDCDVLSIMSGVPRFVEWGHRSDLSYMDELRIFDKALSAAEIGTIIADANN